MRFLFLLLGLALGLLTPAAQAQRVACEGGLAQPEGSDLAFACDGVDLLGHLSTEEMGSQLDGFASDIWGWTDPETGREYAIVGIFEGIGIVDVTDAENPLYLGKLDDGVTDNQAGGLWRDVKVYADHAYAVSEARDHGVQVFDLTQLRDVASPPVTFSETARYDGVTDSHNIVINEATGFAYVVGANSGTESGCNGGLHMLDLSEPAAPTFAGCFSADGYTHDAQCVVYDGPDADYAGREVCFAFNEDTVTLVDVTDKAAPAMISQAIYPNVDYTHQGWLTEDHRYLIANDEGDESEFAINTRTLVFDVTDLDEPEFLDAFVHDTESTDHNLYVKGPFVFQANYSSGLRILDATSLLSGGSGSGLELVAHFDTHPESNVPGTSPGAWGVYPFFASGNIIINDRGRGLFVLQPQIPGLLDAEEDTAPESNFALSAAYPNPFATRTQLNLRLGTAQAVRVEVYDVLGRSVATLFDGVLGADERRTVAFDGAGRPAGTYLVRVTGEDFAETRHVTLTR